MTPPYFIKLIIQANEFSKIGRRLNKVEYLYDAGFSYDEINDMGYGFKKIDDEV